MGFAASPRSSIPEITWPAWSTLEAAHLLAILHQLDQSQWWTPDALARMQFRQLTPLVRHAYRTAPAYHARLAEAGYTGGEEISASLWRRIPVLSRRDVQQAGGSLHSTSVPAAHGPTTSTATSGSTGTPVTVKKTALEQIYWQAFTLREELWQRRDFRAKLAIIRAFHAKHSTYPAGSLRESWGPPVASVFPTGPCALLDISTGLAQQAEWMVRQNPTYMLSSSTNLMFLARHCREAGLRLPALRAVRSFGEIVDAEVRDTCRDIWGVEVADIYTTVEAGYLALQCAEHDHYHVQSESALVEILDEAGEPVSPGQLGRVVVTPLHNFATPLLRYEVGDYAELGETCPCGRGLPVLKRILGRGRDIVVLPSGERRFGWLSSRGFAKIEALIQHQIVQKSPEEMEVKLVAHRPLTQEEIAIVRATIVQGFGHDFVLTFSYHDELPRSASGKFFVFRSEVPA
jgi:phenylacetate-CoA ligase